MSKLLDASARLTLALAQSAALIAVLLLFAAARALAADAATSNQAAGEATAYAGSPQTCVQTVDSYGRVVTRC